MTLNKTITKLEDTQGLLPVKCPCCKKDTMMIYHFIWDDNIEYFAKFGDKELEHRLDYKCFRCQGDVSLASIKRYNYPWCYEI